jgi:hypothetical protein
MRLGSPPIVSDELRTPLASLIPAASAETRGHRPPASDLPPFHQDLDPKPPLALPKQRPIAIGERLFRVK